MTTLRLYEGKDYSPGQLASELGDVDEGARNALSERCFDALLNLSLQAESLSLWPGSSRDEAGDDDEPDFTLEDGRRCLARPLPGKNRKLRIGHVVGAAYLLDGEVSLEVLPKIGGHDTDVARAGLLRMWTYAADLQRLDNDSPAGMALARLPLQEWLVRRFLQQLEVLVAKGLRAAYIEHEANLNTVRGRMLVSENLRANAFAPHRFYCRFEDFSPDRPENRLIRSALAVVMAGAKDRGNRRLAADLIERLHEVPPSADIAGDFARWQDDRLMADYREIRSTCQWLLMQSGPAPVQGPKQMLSRFVRMNDVFERYVTRWLRERLQPHGWEVLEQARDPWRSEGRGGDRAARVLCRLSNEKTQTLRPDIVVVDRNTGNTVAVLDAKWKGPRGDDRLASRDDLFQMFAYASHWLANGARVEANGAIALVYPHAGEAYRRDGPQAFDFPLLQGVHGFALTFQLPRKNDRAWLEGLQLDRAVKERCACLEHASVTQ